MRNEPEPAVKPVQPEPETTNKLRPDFPSAQLRGVTNLAVLADIKPGFVSGFETVTYVERLRRLLTALNTARVITREASTTTPIFPDPIGRFQIIQSFRYAIVKPHPVPVTPAGEPSDPGLYRLSLNVTFDGGWEPYMRVIYSDIGTLLDALFCNCVGYPGSKTSSFDAYSRWVRENELGGGLFYTDSGLTLGDQKYLERVERIQRDARDPMAADRAIAAYAIEPTKAYDARALKRALDDPWTAANQGLRTLKGLHRLIPYFPPNASQEDGILLRFAQDVLSGFRAFDETGSIGPGTPLEKLGLGFSEELNWLRTPLSAIRHRGRKSLGYVPGELQAGIVAPLEGISHGCVVLLRIEDPDLAAEYFTAWNVSKGLSPTGLLTWRNAAFTYAGLRALGFSKERLDVLPQEFIEGMQARAGLLGDLRCNHPDNWSRPKLYGSVNAEQSAAPIDLSTVHAVVILRLGDAAQALELHPQLQGEIDDLNTSTKTGLTVLSVQPMRSYQAGAKFTTDHFGFADGLSQPSPAADPTLPDGVKLGEVLLGYDNGRNDGPFPPVADPLLDNGSFLVMRKLRQHLEVLHEVVGKEAATLAPNPDDAAAMKETLLEKMMGRRKDGTTMVFVRGGSNTTNSFDYLKDPTGLQCPFQSHVRRSNPRDGRAYTPRIVRRGMSYGPRLLGTSNLSAERGVVFMAFCASIAEQFEVLQRWIAGGNSSGVSSGQADPFLGVPEAGELRTFRFLDEDGAVRRVHLGERPFVSLQWGLYLFMPSLATLKGLMDPLLKPIPRPPQQLPRPTSSEQPWEPWRRVLEDSNRERIDAAWQEVRSAPYFGMRATDYGLLVGNQTQILEVLQDDGRKFSVSGYGDRMRRSVGMGFLGQDDPEHEALASKVNDAVMEIDAKQAFDAARPIAEKVLTQFGFLALAEPGLPLKVPVDLLTLSEKVLSGLCSLWFGLPDPAANFMKFGGRVSDSSLTPPRCPGHLFSASRYVFSPHATVEVANEGQAQGKAVLKAFEDLLAPGNPPLKGTLALAIQSVVNPHNAQVTAVQASVEKGSSDNLLARTLAGVMMGFPPTVHGNFMRTIDSWITSARLWELQTGLDQARAGEPDAYARADKVLLGPLIETMRQRPVPEMIWRTAGNGACLRDEKIDDIKVGTKVVLGLASALTDKSANHYLMFGGRKKKKSKLGETVSGESATGESVADGPVTVHACPGYDMAIGVLLALTSALLEAGQLRPTGSSIQLTLIRPAS